MVFFDFNYVTDPPNDELVDEQVQLNANLDKIDSRIQEFAAPDGIDAVITNPPVGSEAPRATEISVWNGTAWRAPDHLSRDWTTWVPFPLETFYPVTARPGFTPMWRVNETIRCVELCGGVHYNSGDPWPRSQVYITEEAADSIPAAYQPANDTQWLQTGTSAPSPSTSFFSGARIEVVRDGAIPYTAVAAWFQGDDGGGNFIMLDGIRWWY